MKHYTYFIWTPASFFIQKQILFECDASDILEADKQYKDATGKEVSKQSGVQCTWN